MVTLWVSSMLVDTALPYLNVIHIAFKIIGYAVSVERDQTVIRIVLEAAIGSRGYIARSVIAEDFGRDHRIIAEFLDHPRSYSAETIISITHFGGVCKYFFEKTASLESVAIKFFLLA